MSFLSKLNTSWNKTTATLAWNGLCIFAFATMQEFWHYQPSATWQAAVQGLPSVLIPLLIANKPPDAPPPPDGEH